MAVGQHHFQQLASEAIALLDGLIGIGIGANEDGLWLIGRFGKLPAQQVGCIAFGKQLALEIETGGELQIGMAGSGIAVDAAVFAPLIGVDGATKGDIRRAVVADDAACIDLPHLGARHRGGECGIPIGRLPVVIDRFNKGAAKTVIDIVGAASSCHIVHQYCLYIQLFCRCPR